jgi:hypothetical protein
MDIYIKLKNNMKKVIRLTESDLVRLVQRVVKEQTLNEAEQAQMKSKLDQISKNPTPEQKRLKAGIMKCLETGSYPHITGLVATGSACAVATISVVIMALTAGFSAPLTAIAMSGCAGASVMGMGDFYQKFQKEVADVKMCLGMKTEREKDYSTSTSVVR